MTTRARLRPWLESMIDSVEVPGLVWLNVERTKFRIPWKHRSKQDWSPDSGKIFLEWAKHTGRYIEGVHKVDYSRWKTRLRCAFNKAKDFTEVEAESNEHCSDPYRVYLLSDVKPLKRETNESLPCNSKSSSADNIFLTDELDDTDLSIANLFLQQSKSEDSLRPATIAELESIDSISSFDNDFPADLKGTQPQEFVDPHIFSFNILQGADVLSMQSSASHLRQQQPICDQSEQRPISSQSEQRPISSQSEQRPIYGQSEQQPISGQSEQQPISEQSESVSSNLIYPTSEFTAVPQLMLFTDHLSFDEFQSHLGSIDDFLQQSLDRPYTESFEQEQSEHIFGGGGEIRDSSQMQDDFYDSSQCQGQIFSIESQTLVSNIEYSCLDDSDYDLQYSSESPAVVIANTDHRHSILQYTSDCTAVLIEDQQLKYCTQSSDSGEVSIEAGNDQSDQSNFLTPDSSDVQQGHEQMDSYNVLMNSSDQENVREPPAGSPGRELNLWTSPVLCDLQQGLELTVNYCGIEVLQRTITKAGCLFYSESSDDGQTFTVHNDSFPSTSSENNSEHILFPKWSADAMQKSNADESIGTLREYMKTAGLSLLRNGLTKGISLMMTDSYDIYACRECRSAIYFLSELETNGKPIKIPSDQRQCKPVSTKIFSYNACFVPALNLYIEGRGPRPDPITYIVMGQKLDCLENISNGICIYATVVPKKVLRDLQLADSLVALKLAHLHNTGKDDDDVVQPADECHKRVKC